MLTTWDEAGATSRCLTRHVLRKQERRLEPPEDNGHDEQRGGHEGAEAREARCPHGQRVLGGRVQRENFLIERGARLRAHGRRVRGWRGAATPSGWPGDLGSSRGTADSPSMRVLGRRVIHGLSVEFMRLNGVILALMRRASHTFVFEIVGVNTDRPRPRQYELLPVSWTLKLKSREWEAFRVCGSAVEA